MYIDVSSTCIYIYRCIFDHVDHVCLRKKLRSSLLLKKMNSFRSIILVVFSFLSGRSDDGSKQVYLFLKLWRPPLLHYHDDLPRQPARLPTKPSPYAFYHTYGKRSDSFEQSAETGRSICTHILYTM